MNRMSNWGGVSSLFESVGPLLMGKCTLHHVGVVVASISAAADEFAHPCPQAGTVKSSMILYNKFAWHSLTQLTHGTQFLSC